MNDPQRKPKTGRPPSHGALRRRIDELTSRLQEAEDTLKAIREGEVDAIVVSGQRGDQLFSLAGAESVYRLIVETMKEAALTLTFEGRILFANAQFSDFIKVPLEQILGRPLVEFIAPGEHGVLARLVSECRQSRAFKTRLVFQGRQGRVPSHVSSSALYQGDQVSLCFVATDLSELEASTEMLQKLRQQQDLLEKTAAQLAAANGELRESEQRLLEASQIGHLGYIDWDLANNKVCWSPETFRIFGCDPAQFVPTFEATLRMIWPEDKEMVEAQINQAIRGAGKYNLEHRLARPDGTVVHVQAKGHVTCDEHGKPLRLLGIIVDITEHKHAEEYLRERQRLDTVAHLAGGVAHEFNNSLAAMMLQLSCLRGKPGLDSETQAAYADLQSGMNRTAMLTRQLLMFSRQSVMQLKPVDLAEITSGMLRVIRRMAGDSFKVEFTLGGSLPLVMADVGLIEQCVMNLCLNAREATPPNGCLTLSVRGVTLDASQCLANRNRRPGRFACLSVADTGCGMDEATVNRLFEPFFTTKEVGKGTGMGLPSVHGAVLQHRGWLEVESRPAIGSTFRIFLPAIEPPASPMPARIKGQATGRGTILLVEDDLSLRLVVARYLRSQGYEVLEASGAEQALSVWEKRQPDIGLLLSDMLLPGNVTGLQLAHRFRASRPELKVILSSGYHVGLAQLGLPAGTDFVLLPKPYEAEDLARSVRECLPS